MHWYYWDAYYWDVNRNGWHLVASTELYRDAAGARAAGMDFARSVFPQAQMTRGFRHDGHNWISLG